MIVLPISRQSIEILQPSMFFTIQKRTINQAQTKKSNPRFRSESLHIDRFREIVV